MQKTNNDPESYMQGGIMVTREMLTGRMARCGYSCNNTRPSTDALDGKLPFFEYRGPGSAEGARSCKHCGFFDVAHQKHEMARNVPSNRLTVVEQGKCPGFESRGSFDCDLYYCGCRGWD